METRKRALVISYYFAPQNAIGAVRPTKLAKYLTRMGYEVTVICGAGMTGEKDPTLERDSGDLHEVRVIREWNPLRDYKARKETKAPRESVAVKPATREAEGGHGGLARRMVNGLYLYLWMLSDRSFQRRAIRELSALKGPFDAVFSSYAPLSVHAAAREAKRRGLARRWIADFRDEVNAPFSWQKGYLRRYMTMLRREADVLSAVSDGFLETMGLQGCGKVLSNGYDREDLPDLQPLPEPTRKRFHAVYCGQFRMGRKGIKDRDITPIFSALRELIDEGVLQEDELALSYAGDEGKVFRAYATACDLERCVTDYGRVSRRESLALQKGADALLLASWNGKGQTGILTGKLFEYMMMEKPIIGCVSGDLPGSGVARVLRDTGAGYCYEEGNGAADARRLTAYLRGMLVLWRQDKPLFASKQVTEMEKFSYPQLARQLAAWIEEDDTED